MRSGGLCCVVHDPRNPVLESARESGGRGTLPRVARLLRVISRGGNHSMSGKPHIKLSDVEAGKNYALPRVEMAFQKAYPEVKSLRIDVRVSDTWGKAASTFILTERYFRSIIDCPNPRCAGGGVDIDRLLRWSVIEGRKTAFEDMISCCGHEGSPKGRRRTGSCDVHFHVKIQATYNE